MPLATFPRFLCALMTLICFGCDWSSAEARKARHLERAATYFEKGQYQEALIEYKNVTDLDPTDADASYRLALTHLKLGGQFNLRQAFSVLQETVKLNRANYDAQLKLAELYLLDNQPGKAREHADLALVSAPQNADSFILRGRSLLDEKRYQEAIAEIKKALELDPKNTRAYIDLARAYVFLKDLDSAEAALNQGLAIDPQSVEMLLALGDFRVTTGKPEQAEAVYKKALAAAPQRDEIYLRLASFYQRYGKWAEVEASLQQLASIKPDDEKPHIYLGDFFTWRGQPDKARLSYQRATEINPRSTMARDKLISHYLDTGKVSEAETKIRPILEKTPRDLSGRFFDARVQFVKGNTDEAIASLQTIIKEEPSFALAHHFLGMAFLQKKQPGQARGALLEAVKLNPNSPESRTALAQLYLNEGSIDLAIEQAQAAIQLNPRNVQAAIISGDGFLRKGDLNKSKQIFEAVASALPNEPIGPYRLGLVARAEKDDPKALAYFEEALTRKPTAIEPIAQIATIKSAQGKTGEARNRVAKQLEVVPDSPLLYNLLGELWMKEKDLGQAEQAFRQAIALDNTLLSGYMNLGQTYYLSGKVDQAVQEYEAVVAKDPGAIQAHMMLGIIHSGRKEHEKAQARYEAILRINPQFAPAANNLAWILVEHGGNLDVALGYAQTAREQRPDDPYVADTIGWIYYKKNAYLLAGNLLKEAAEKLPNEPIVNFHYGMAQHKNGNTGAAKKALQTALKLNPNFAGSDEARKTLAGL